MPIDYRIVQISRLYKELCVLTTPLQRLCAFPIRSLTAGRESAGARVFQVSAAAGPAWIVSAGLPDLDALAKRVVEKILHLIDGRDVAELLVSRRRDLDGMGRARPRGLRPRPFYLH